MSEPEIQREVVHANVCSVDALAHDFKNLLLAIRLNLETIGEIAGNGEAARLARQAMTAVDRATMLAGELRAGAGPSLNQGIVNDR